MMAAHTIYARVSICLSAISFGQQSEKTNGRKLHVMSSGAVTMGRNALPRVLSRLLTLGEGGPARLLLPVLWENRAPPTL